ncbi:MAG: hypothetical protein Q8P24_15790 [Desulfobacterales bacterium]|nr:hypothetical protein [Desulfobacterales bacterium]
MERLHYFIRRFLLVIPTFLGITVLCFTLIQFVPGGPVEQIVLEMKGIGTAESGKGPDLQATITPQQRKALEAHFGWGLKGPCPDRYFSGGEIFWPSPGANSDKLEDSCRSSFRIP